MKPVCSILPCFYLHWKPFIMAPVTTAVIPALLWLTWIFLEVFLHLRKLFNFLHIEATSYDK